MPRSVTRLASGARVVDLGQNINGWLRLTDLGPAGTELTITHGEWVAPDGDVVVEAGEDEAVLDAVLTRSAVADVRRANPSLANRRM